MSQPFDPIAQPFVKGITCIEASAGTGKTYSIAYLVLRLVVEQGLPIDKILTVTFTKAATEELKERIRAKLYAARMAYDTPSGDAQLMDWIDTRHATRDLDIALLNRALVDIDLAGVYTIHGFCQRILTEFPLESQQSFDLTLSNEAALLKEQIVHDFWRQFTYDLTPIQADVFSQLETSPETLVEWLKEIGQSEVVLLPAKTAEWETVLHTIEVHTKTLNTWLSTHEKPLLDWFSSNQKKFKAKGVNVFQNLSSKFLELTAFSTFNELLSGTQFKDKGEQTGEERRSDFWDTFVTMFQPPIFAAQAYQEALPSLEISLKHTLYRYYRAELTQRLDAQGVLGFDDLILRLAQILSNEDACGDMKQAIQQRYGAALIDEFQDTDAEQWHIFYRLFGSGHHYLYLIGDPKQAIYKFRGADIDTYIEAVNQADVALTLGFNWRSAPNLVAATNELFKQKDNPFGNKQLPFQPVEPGVKYKPDDTVVEQPLHFWLIAEKDDGTSRTTQNEETLICHNVCLDILERLADPSKRPEDFAILVRNNFIAKRYQQALATLKIPAVLRTKDSVFLTDEAKSLYRILEALLQPNRLSLAKNALAEPIFSPTLESFMQANEGHNQKLEQWITSLYEAADIWQNNSLFAAMTYLFETHHAYYNLGRYQNAERRITNLRHILELLQEHVLNEALSPQQTLQALARFMVEQSSDERELRLESDVQALQIVTIHSSKGLQYPIVYCPDLYLTSQRALKSSLYRVKQNGQWHANVNQEGLSILAEQMHADVYNEDTRLMYVALTRAEHETIVVMPEHFAHPIAEGEDIDTHKSALRRLLPKGLPQHSHITSRVVTDHNLYGHGIYQPVTDNPDASLLQTFTRIIDKRYRMTSFSGLSKSTHEESARAKASDEEFVTDEAVVNHDILPKGAHFGNLLHDVLELSDFAQLAKSGVDVDLVMQLIKKHGVFDMLQQSKDAEETLHPILFEAFNQLVQNTVQGPLERDNSIALKDVSSVSLLKEMPFYFPLSDSTTQSINELMESHAPEIPFVPIQDKSLVGHLNGYVDLIAQYNGKFYVMDYKSNFIAQGYDHKAMHNKMSSSNYGLQGVLYTLALHRYLQQRLLNYQYDEHIGGVRYLFCRGMRDAESEQGVYRYEVPFVLIEALDALFTGESVHAH
jgi:exodeoxyribonuclease V beta subunit